MRKITNSKLAFMTFDEVLKKESRSKTFMKGYNEELMRFRLAGEIKKTRTAMHLTQRGVARKANMPQSVIARIESGQHSISLTTLNRIAEVLGKRVELV